jgi:hypothetical protein
MNPYADFDRVPWLGHQIIAKPLPVQNLLGATVRSRTCLFYCIDFIIHIAVSEAVSSWALTNEAWFRSQAIQYSACDGVTLGTDSLLVLQPTVVTFISSILSCMHRHPLVGHGLLIIEASRSHSDTPHSVGLLWTSDQPDAEKSSWKYTTLKKDRHSCPRRDSNPQMQETSGRRPTT